jgi:ABC-type amino acid transport substrate-binding protein
MFRATLLACLIISSQVQGGVFAIRTAPEVNAAPKWLDDGRAGLCADVLHAIEAATPSIRFTFPEGALPQTRLMQYLASDKLDIACGIGRRPGDTVDYVVLPTVVYEDRLVGAVRAADDLRLDSLDDLRSLGRDNVILLNHGARLVERLHAMGLTQLDADANGPEQNLKKLAAGRGRLFLYHEPGLSWEIDRSGLAGQLRVLPTEFEVGQHYMMVSRRLARPAIEALAGALAAAEQRGDLRRIIGRWSHFTPGRDVMPSASPPSRRAD